MSRKISRRNMLVSGIASAGLLISSSLPKDLHAWPPGAGQKQTP